MADTELDAIKKDLADLKSKVATLTTRVRHLEQGFGRPAPPDVTQSP